MKNTKSFYPKNGLETEKFVKKTYKINGPTFISLKNDIDLNKNW